MTSEVWLNGRRGQTLAVGIMLLGLLVVWFGIVDPARSWFDNREAVLEQRRDMLAHMRDLAATLPALQAVSADKRDAGTQAAAIMLPGDSDSVAAADLQELVQKMAADAGASLTAIETLPSAAAAGRWHKVALRINLNAPWPVLMRLIRSVENSPMRILIDDVHFHSPTIVAHPTVAPIQASMVLYGFRSADTGGRS